MKSVFLVLNKSVFPIIYPLIKAWDKKKIETYFMFYKDDDFPAIDKIKSRAQYNDAVIAFAPASRSPYTLISQPFLEYKKNKKIPISLVPVISDESLKKFIETACSIHNRKKMPTNVSVMCQRIPRYLNVTQKIVKELSESDKLKCMNWQGDIIYPEDALFGINAGGALTVYMGHGRAKGWAGYRGIQLQEMEMFANKPNAAVLSLCCETASRRNVQLSFSEELILNGLSGFALGAARKTLFTDNARWAVSISKEIRKGHKTVGSLLTSAIPVNTKSYSSYRFFGDPTVPLYPDSRFYSEVKKIKTYE